MSGICMHIGRKPATRKHFFMKKTNLFKDTHREKAPANKTLALTKCTNLEHQINSLQEVLKLK